MTVARSAFFVGLLCGLAVAIWAAGILFSIEGADSVDRQSLALGIRGLWIAQAMALSVLVPWYCLHFGWRDSATGALVLILAPSPIASLGWFTGAADITLLGLATLFLAGGAFLLIAISKGICYVVPNQLFQVAAAATVQILGATAALVHGVAWIELTEP